MGDSGHSARRARFAKTVDRLRRRAGLSLEELAELSEIDRDELDAILDGEIEARFDTIHLLAGALRVDPGDLFDGVAWIPDEKGGGRFRVDGE